jgi:hypothetical protein
MSKMEKLTEHQLVERHKRIPARTQKTLNQMIRRRSVELTGKPALQNQPQQNLSALEKG